MRKLIFTIIPLLFCLFVSATVWQVGPTRTYTAPSQVMPLVNHSDTVEIDAGVYVGNVGAWTKDSLLIRGVGGLAHMRANGQYAQGKAIWVVQGDNTTIEWIEFSEASVPDQNGAGIRQEGTHLTLRFCYFHDNENGILAGDNSNSNILIEFSEFARNGYGQGYTHNLYINHVNSLVFRYCYSHHANVGHNLKSRAYNNFIMYNRIMDEQTGDASMLVDISNGGLTYIVGNILMQGPNAVNKRLITYGVEGWSNPVREVYIYNNTLHNERHTGEFVVIQNGATTAKVFNNIFTGIGTQVVGPAWTQNNFYRLNPANVGFVNYANYNYHLTDLSAAVNAGTDTVTDGIRTLLPFREYVHPVFCIWRNQVAAMDIGAYENQNVGGACEEVQTLWTANVKPTSARLQWNASSGAVSYQVRGRRIGVINWTYLGIPPGSPSFKDVFGLSNNNSYEWQIIAFCDSTQTDSSAWSQLDTFTTGCYGPDSSWTGPVTSTGARLNWTPSAGSAAYEIRGKRIGASTWTTILVGGATTFKDVFGLTTNTSYHWTIRSWCDTAGIKQSVWAPLAEFTTSGSSRLGQQDHGLMFQNPCTQPCSIVMIDLEEQSGSLELYDIEGRLIFEKSGRSNETCTITTELNSGLYFVKWNGRKSLTRRLVIK